MTVAEVKALLRIPNDKNDTYLAAIIPVVEDFVKAYCNTEFLDETTQTTVYPGGVKLAIAQLCRYHMKEGQIQYDPIRNNTSEHVDQYPSDVLHSLNYYRIPNFEVMEVITEEETP
jgi:hypothetical protein